MVVVEPILTEEKLRELLAEGHEESALDYKQTLDLNERRDIVELAKDLGAMRAEPNGGYIVVGVDDSGSVLDTLTGGRARLFDEAIVRSKISRYLSEPLDLRTAVHTLDDGKVALIYVGPHSNGWCIFKADGNYQDPAGRTMTVFREGDVYVRHGTASERWTPADQQRLLDRTIASRKGSWLAEFREDLAAVTSSSLSTQRIEAARPRELATDAITEFRSISSLARTALPIPAEPYVHRHAFEQKLGTLLDTQTPLIVLTGPPSIGKRTLIRRMIDERIATSDHVMRLDGSSPQAAQASIIAALIEAGVDLYGIDVATIHYRLKKFVAEARPRYVLIENAGDSDLILFLAGVCDETTVLATTTKRRLPKTDGKYYLSVTELELTEATELVRQLLPDTAEEDAISLAATLGRHPLAITTACGTIKRDGRTTVADFLSGLERNMAVMFDGERRSEYPALTQLYRQTLTELEESDPQALRALELLVFLHDADAPSAFIVYALAHALEINPSNASHIRSIAQRALNCLYDRHLVTLIEGGIYVRVPQLAKTIISQLVYARGSDIAQHLRDGILSFVKRTRHEMADKSLIEFTHMHQLTLVHLTTASIDPRKRGGPIAHLAIFSYALQLFLEAIDEDLRSLVPVMFQTSETSFSLLTLPVADALEMGTPMIAVRWDDNYGHHSIEAIVHDWRAHEKMLSILVDRSSEAEVEVEAFNHEPYGVLSRTEKTLAFIVKNASLVTRLEAHIHLDDLREGGFEPLPADRLRIK